MAQELKGRRKGKLKGVCEMGRVMSRGDEMGDR